MSFKKWNILKYDKEEASGIAERFNLNPVTAVMLSSRSLTDEESISSLLFPDENLIDPYTLPDMDLAVERIGAAIDGGERILIYGDFDADGVTATALLYLYLKDAGAQVDYFIPDRNSDGYGLHKETIEPFIGKTDLIITVDNGISAYDEIYYANENGIDVVVTDHHMQGGPLPEAYAVVNPHRYDNKCEYDDWAGVGVAFKLICALDGDEDEILNRYADLIAIGTIADVVSVLGENRYIIKKGLELINSTSRLGIAALKGVAGVVDKKLSSTDVAFTLSPRINAAGRMGSAMRAVKLLITEDADEAIKIAEEINAANADRIAIENEMFEEADTLLREDDDLRRQKILIVTGKNWHSGVSGIVASKIVEKYSKPCIVIADNGEDILKGSCRSVEGFSVFDALNACADTLVQFGGHTLAAGLSVKREKLNEFISVINDYAHSLFHYMPTKEIDIDFKINPLSINLDTLDAIEILQPFGTDNPKPLFGLYKMQLLNVSSLAGNKHVRLKLEKNDAVVYAVYFNHSTSDLPFSKGDVIDLAVTLEKNVYYGKVSVSVIVKEIKINGTNDDNLVYGKQMFENFMNCKLKNREILDVAVDRRMLAQVYRFVRDNNGWRFSYEDMYMKMKSKDMTFAQMLLALEIMKELELLIENKEMSRVDIPIETVRKEISDSSIFQKMKADLKSLSE